jgi:enoyl-CoA hydratase/carnithine racemase
MEETITEHSGSILRVQLNRPTKRNAMTSSMYVTLPSDGECYEAQPASLRIARHARLT